ncbi:MAG: UbiD family decarboxylase, partial [Candidatus Binatia bacterium]|nr:UbiD family decarboxylase [Candidatus Binatia bacterium]
MFEDLRAFIAGLEEAGELVRIREELSPLYEIPAAIREVDKQTGSAVFFEQVKGYPIPVVGNLLARRSRLALAMGIPEKELVSEYTARRQRSIPPQIIDQAPIKEVIIDKDVRIADVIPVLTHHQRDVGPYFTTAVTMAKDPVTGLRGMGVHRIQVKGDDTLGVFLATPPMSHFFQKAEERGQPLEVAIAIGLDPITFFSSIGEGAAAGRHHYEATNSRPRGISPVRHGRMRA